MRDGRSGNDVLLPVRKRMTAEGIKGSVYSHPIGDRGHGAGPLSACGTARKACPDGRHGSSSGKWFSIEVNARTPVPDWGVKGLFVGMDEDIVLDDGGAAR